jgi:hypothetical protein
MKSSAVTRCGRHGKAVTAIVCCHHVAKTDHVLGFVETCSEPDNLQAWCDDCERLFASEGDMTEAFRRYNDFKVVCGACYAEIRARHTRNEFNAPDSNLE